MKFIIIIINSLLLVLLLQSRHRTREAVAVSLRGSMAELTTKKRSTQQTQQVRYL